MLKVSGDMKRPSVIAILMCMCDVIFNFFLIFSSRTIKVCGIDIPVFGFGLGVKGAALGTLLSFVAASIPLIYYAVFRSKILSWKLDTHRFVWVWDYIYHASKLSMPMALQYILFNGAQVISTMIVAPLGKIAIASNSLAVTAESLCYMPGYGIGEAATTIVGRDLCKSFAFMSIAIGMLVMAFMGAIMFIFAPEMIGMLSPVSAIRELGAEVMRIEAFAEPFFAAGIVSYNVCIGAGDTLKPSLINLSSMWFVRLTLAFALASHYGLRGVWFAMAVELTFRGIMFLIRIVRGSWMNNISIQQAKI